MATRDDLYQALRNADAAGDTEGARKLASYIQSLDAPAAPAPAPAPSDKGYVSSLGAGLGKGFGDVVLGAQRLVGKGVQAVGETLTPDEQSLSSLVSGKGKRGPIQSAGDWLVKDAEQGKARMAAENAPYKEAHPIVNATGTVGGNVVATLPVGGGVASLLGRVPGVASAAPGLLNAIRTGGMEASQAAPGVAGAVTNMLTRSAGGAITGGISAGLVDPEQAAAGAVVGAALPPAVKLAGQAGNALSDAASSGAKRLMQSAIKPTIKQLKSGDAATAVDTLLEYGINPTKAGVEKLRNLIDSRNSEISNLIGSSSATVDKNAVLNALGGVRQKFGNQVSPTGDLSAIENVANDFASHPNLPSNDIPVQVAQKMKQGTYNVLSGKYGQMGSAETEAQKALARGLKDEIASAVPGVGPLNAEESRLLTTLNVSERRALMEMNKNPMGLAALAHDPVSFALFMADKSAAFKALAARALNASAPAGRLAGQGALGLASNPLLRSSGVLAASEANP